MISGMITKPIGGIAARNIQSTAAVHTNTHRNSMMPMLPGRTAIEAEVEDKLGVVERVADVGTIVGKRATIITSNDNLLLTKSLA